MSLCLSRYMCAMCMQEPVEIRSITSLELVRDGCEPPCGYWELNTSLLQRAVGALALNRLAKPAPL